MDSVEQRSDCTFSAVWSWSTLSIKSSCVVLCKEKVKKGSVGITITLQHKLVWANIAHDLLFMPPYRKSGGAYCFTIVCLSIHPSIHLSVCLHKLNVKTEHFPITPKLIYLQSSYLVWRHISSICICWYQGHLQRSRSNIKVTFLKKWPFRGHSCFTNTSCYFLNI